MRATPRFSSAGRLGAWALTLLLLACSRPEADGRPYEVTVLADRARQAALAPLLDSLFAETWVSSPPERKLAWRWGDPEHLAADQCRRNLILVLDGPAAGTVGRFAEELLGAGMRDRVSQGEVFLLRRPGAFARRQLLVILAAPDPAAFRRQLLQRRLELRALFDEHEAGLDRLALRPTRLQLQLEDSLALSCGFRLDIPGDWFVIQGGTAPTFIRLRRLNPDCWITVHWVDGPDSQRLDPAGLWAVRDRLGGLFWEKEACRPGGARFSRTRLGGLEATLLEGTLASAAAPAEAAGPFLCWALHVPGAAGLPQGRTFYIDAAVRCPDEPRSPWLHQLTTLVSTFAGTDAEGRAIGPLQPESE